MSIEEFEFKEMLGMLDESYRIILVLYYVEGFRIADIASILNMNENTVKTRLVRDPYAAKAGIYFSRR